MPAEDEIIARVRGQLPRLINETIARPEYTFREIVTGVAANLNSLPAHQHRPENIAHYLSETPKELTEFEQRLGATCKFGFQNIGDRALVLTYDDEKGRRQILRLTRHAEAAIPNSQSFHAGHRIIFNGIHISVSEPAITLHTLVEMNVITLLEADTINARMKVEAARDGLVYHDELTSNTAITANGRVVIIDAGAVTTETLERIRLPQHFSDTPELATNFLAKIDADIKLALTLPPINAGIAPATENAGLLSAFLSSGSPTPPLHASPSATKTGVTLT